MVFQCNGHLPNVKCQVILKVYSVILTSISQTSHSKSISNGSSHFLRAKPIFWLDTVFFGQILAIVLRLPPLDHAHISQPLDCSQEPFYHNPCKKRPKPFSWPKKWPRHFLAHKMVSCWMREFLVLEPKYGFGSQNGAPLEMLQME